jgi:AcrR family transcriptional regulator
MDALRTDDPPRLGLRERKKAKTRSLIQEHALRLFRERGYDETSIEEIADAAEVSPSTVFRYFPTKPDLVIYDDLDERMIEAFRSQPPELNALQAMRASFRSGFGDLAGEEMALQLERESLMRSVPELQSAMLSEFARTVGEIAELVGERAGRPADDDAVLALAGAIIGVAIAAWFASDDRDSATARFLERMDAGMALLEAGFRL